MAPVFSFSASSSISPFLTYTSSLLTVAAAAAGVYVSRFVGGWAAVYPSALKNWRLPPMRGKVVVVTGSNAGIGLRCADALATAGATVVLACRSVARGAEARDSIIKARGLDLASIEVMALDLASMVSIQSFATTFQARFDRLDILILNGGVAKSFLGHGGFELTADGLESMVGINFLGHFLLTLLLLPVLRKTLGARVIGQSSVAMGNSYSCGIDVRSWVRRAPDFQDWMQYGQSKLAIRLFMKELQRREPTLMCMACHPGVVAETGLMADGQGWLESLYRLFMFRVLAMSPEHSHLSTVYLAAAPAETLEGGMCYLPIGRKLEWMSHPLQRLGALQAPVPMRTSHPGLWASARETINERAVAIGLHRVLPEG